MGQSEPYTTVQSRKLVMQLQVMHAEKAQLSQALIHLQDAERCRLGQALHDDLGQYIAALRAQVKLLQLFAEQPEQVQSIAQCLEQQASHLQQSFRAVVHDLYPVQLEHLSVLQLLQLLQQQWQAQSALCIRVHQLGVLPVLSLATKQQLYRLLQEALCNARQHGQATHVHVWLQYKQQAWRILLRDNGRGGVLAQAGVGLHSMAARAQAMQAQFYTRPRVMRGWSLYLCAPLLRGEQ